MGLVKAMNRICEILKSKRGESLLESIVSILIFTIMMVTVTAIIGTSLNLTANADKKTTEWQQGALNPAILNKSAETTGSVTISFTGSASGAGTIKITQKIKYGKNAEVFSFVPVD